MPTDVAKLKRIRSAVASVVSATADKPSRGAAASYESLRAATLEAVPEGLHLELGSIAPPPDSSPLTPGHDYPDAILQATMQGEEARVRLAALQGWLDALINKEHDDE